MMVKGDMRREAARDFIALGSVIFYVLVVARSIIGPYTLLIYQLLISALVLFVFSMLIREQDGYLARGFVLLVLLSLFYSDDLFSGFATLVFLVMVYSSNYLGSSWNRIFVGLVSGAVSVAVAYSVAGMFA